MVVMCRVEGESMAVVTEDSEQAVGIAEKMFGTAMAGVVGAGFEEENSYCETYLQTNAFAKQKSNLEMRKPDQSDNHEERKKSRWSCLQSRIEAAEISEIRK